MAFARFKRVRALTAYQKAVIGQVDVAIELVKEVNETKAQIESNKRLDWQQGGDLDCFKKETKGLTAWLPVAERLRDRAIKNIGDVSVSAVERE